MKNRWESGICEVNGIDVHYLRTGGDKPPVILLHGLMTSGACWLPPERFSVAVKEFLQSLTYTPTRPNV